MRRLVNPLIGIVLLGVALAALQQFRGLATDEAKFLLDIPYPHPPLLRFLMGMTLWVPGQALLWRILLALALLGGTRIAMALLPEEHRSLRPVIGALWILSASVLTLAGQIIMAPVTALQALFFCWLLLRGEGLERHVGWIALLWLASLFTAYQILLFLPVVAVVFWRMRLPAWKRVLCIGVPVLLLILYSVSHPFAVAMMLTAGGQNAGAGSLTEAVRGVVFLWVVGGSLLLSAIGTVGILSSRRWSLILSLLLIVLFILVTYRPYYGILFTPLFVAGIASAQARMPALRRPAFIVLGMVLCALFLAPWAYRPAPPNIAPRVVARALDAGIPKGATMMIAGAFGHDWQYASPYRVLRSVPKRVDDARVYVCLSDCPEVRGREDWTALTGVPVEAWVRPIK